jgi:hypothetical protein
MMANDRAISEKQTSSNEKNAVLTGAGRLLWDDYRLTSRWGLVVGGIGRVLMTIVGVAAVTRGNPQNGIALVSLIGLVAVFWFLETVRTRIRIFKLTERIAQADMQKDSVWGTAYIETRYVLRTVRGIRGIERYLYVEPIVWAVILILTTL